jgi:hypothetical protein
LLRLLVFAVRKIYLDATILTVLFTAVAVVVGACGFRPAHGCERRLVASSTLNRPEFLAFGALFVVVHFPLITLPMKASTTGETSAATDG